ncbi:LamG-like jellyroll fold domain-containing protein [Aurantibacter aestuarii]|uniref:Secretion system C-terminal sorting domain-containing protein n=1 Tax=Aurantibacter aestuarii TaxID=1266046 RepID=A0A2T1NG53_9FLAO|nr:LamG-like jellyroll fold domain-containing protein [Aurantibacter aestuarii]PSG91753.1 hypothetical protein C7H52_01155 [Aurantibacter aestuarii]
MRKQLLFFKLLFLITAISFSQDGTIDASFNTGSGFNGTVKKMTIQNDGKILVGGQFTAYNGVNKNRLLRLNTDGTIDNSFVGFVNDGEVNAIAIQTDGKIIIGGTFGGVNSNGRNRIARLNTDGSLDNSFSYTGGVNGVVYDIKIQSDGKVIAVGNFSSYNGYGGAVDVVRINPNGTPDTSVSFNTNNIVYSVSLQSDDKIILVGLFGSINGVGRNNIARLNTNGSIDNTFNYAGGANGVLFDSKIQSDGKILIAGSFSTYNSYGSQGLLRINSNGTPDTSFNTSIGGNLNSISVQANGKYIITGSFTSVNGIGRNFIARLNDNGSLDNSFSYAGGFNNIGFDSKIQADGKILIGGPFSSYSGSFANRIVRINGTVTGPPTPATHLNFDGINDFVNCGTNSDFDFTTGTVEAFIKVSANSNNKVIVAKRASVSQTRWSLHVNENANTFGVYNGSTFETLNVGVLDPNTWCHVAFVFNASTVGVCMDGVFRGNISTTMNAASTGTPLVIGSSDLINQFPSEYFSGSIDDVRIWNVVRTGTQINNSKSCELLGTETGLISYYKFNQGTDSGSNTGVTTLTDATSNSYDGTLTNFALNGATSNWLAGSPITTGSTCITLSTEFFSQELESNIYPNPTKNTVHINLKNSSQAEIDIYDLNGRLIKNQSVLNNDIIDLSSVANGIYLFKITSNEGVVTKRIIKQ